MCAGVCVIVFAPACLCHLGFRACDCDCSCSGACACSSALALLCLCACWCLRACACSRGVYAIVPVPVIVLVHAPVLVFFLVRFCAFAIFCSRTYFVHVRLLACFCSCVNVIACVCSSLGAGDCAGMCNFSCSDMQASVFFF